MRLGRGTLACLLAAGGLWLTAPVGASGANGVDEPAKAPPTGAVAPSEEPSPDKTSGFGTTPITDPRQDGLYETQDQLAPLLAKYSDVVGETRWSMEAQTNTVELVDNARGDEARREMLSLDVPVKLAFVPVKYSKKLLQDAAVHILETSKSWSGGLEGVSYAAADTGTGSVILGVHMDYLAQWREAVRNAPTSLPVTVRGEAKTGVDFQSRWNDHAAWTGGLALYGEKSSGPGAAVSECTGGWSWTRWSGLGDASSTAEHCVNARDGSGNYLGTTYSPFRNNFNGSLVGAPVLTSPAADVALLQSAGQTYSATVWVGDADTTDYRAVQSAATGDTVTESVALSGKISGLNASTVMAVDVPIALASGTLRVTVLAANLGEKRDSGGPLLQTYSGSGNVRAKGMLIGAYYYQGASRTIYTPITRASSFLSASLKL